MVNLLFIEDDDVLAKPGVVRHHLRSNGRDRRHVIGSRANIAGRGRGDHFLHY